jgi:hypothetical protein
MNVLRTITTQYRYNNGKAQKFDRLSHREPVTPDKLRKTDRTGRKGTISGAHSNDLKYSIQNNKGKLGPKGVLPEGQGVAEGSTTRGGFGGSAGQAQHEIQWLKNKIETLKPLLAKKPSVARQIKDLERQIRERELTISYQKEGMADEFAAMAMKKFPKATVRKNGETLQSMPEKPKAPVVTLTPEQVSDMEQRLEKLKAEYSAMGGDSWQYADRMMPRDQKAKEIYSQMNSLAAQIARAKHQGVAEKITPPGKDDMEQYRKDTADMAKAAIVNKTPLSKNQVNEFAGGMGAASVATAPGVGKGPKVGSLFGGSYAPKTPFNKKRKK